MEVGSYYLMENDQEAKRLDLKTDQVRLEQQAKWAGIRSGMRVADVGCGSGKTSFFLHHLVRDGGEVLGLTLRPIGLTMHAILTKQRDSISSVVIFTSPWLIWGSSILSGCVSFWNIIDAMLRRSWKT